MSCVELNSKETFRMDLLAVSQIVDYFPVFVFLL